MVCLVRRAVTNGTDAIETEGGFPACAQAVLTNRARNISFELRPCKIIPDPPNSRSIGVPFLLSLLRLRGCGGGLRVHCLRIQRLLDGVLDFSLTPQSDNLVHNLAIAADEKALRQCRDATVRIAHGLLAQQYGVVDSHI